MNQHPEHTHHTRRVVLPSGKTIEVVYFDAVELPQTPAHVEAEHGAATDLCCCEECDSHLVYPVDWAESANSKWDVDLRCPNCEWRGAGTYDQHVVDRFDIELDRGTEELVEDLQALTRANMEEEIERFTGALHAGHILPEDF
jgi:hypothetical protein